MYHVGGYGGAGLLYLLAVLLLANLQRFIELKCVALLCFALLCGIGTILRISSQQGKDMRVGEGNLLFAAGSAVVFGAHPGQNG